MAEIVGMKKVFEGWSTLSVATVHGADGVTFERLIEDHGNAVCVLAYDRERKTAMLVRQFRAPVFATMRVPDLLEAVAGLTDGEDPAEAARREAFEEVGLKLTALDFVATLWTMPGVSTERMSLYLARYRPSDQTGQGGGHHHEHENIAVEEVPLKQIAQRADEGTLDDLKTFALVQTLRLREPDLFL